MSLHTSPSCYSCPEQSYQYNTGNMCPSWTVGLDSIVFGVRGGEWVTLRVGTMQIMFPSNTNYDSTPVILLTLYRL